MALGSEWLQGAHLYHLFMDSKSLSLADIAKLYAVTCASNHITSILSESTDFIGRKKKCILSCILYGISIMSLHSNSWGILIFGRALAGISSSILHTSFEAWMVTQHQKTGYPMEWLNISFSLLTYGTSFVAVLVGIISEGLVWSSNVYAPFNVAFFIVILSLGSLLLTWKEENHAPFISLDSVRKLFLDSVSFGQESRSIPLITIVMLCFDTSLFLFMFAWAPAFDQIENIPPYGVIFSSFMCSIMIGSFTYKLIVHKYSPEKLCLFSCILSSIITLLMAFTFYSNIFFIECLLYEFSVGLYLPSIGTLRGIIIPAEIRSVVMNISRIIMTILLVILLLNITESIYLLFAVMSIMLLGSSYAQYQLIQNNKIIENNKNNNKNDNNNKDNLKTNV